MEFSQYLITTLIKAFQKLGPLVLFIVGGYLVFVKLPFLFLKKNMEEQKKKLNAEVPKNEPKLEAPKAKTEHKQEQKKEEKKDPPKKPAAAPLVSPEEVFQFKAGEVINQSELKKRYFELIKQNHPDRVASMGPDFKKLAEKNTKDINDAYAKLKKKAS